MMGKQFKFNVQFEEQDIVSAHRLRYLNSRRLQLLAGIGLLALVYLVLQLALPGLLPPPSGGDLTLPIGVAILGLGTPLVAYLLAPLYDYRTNAIWKEEFTILADVERITVRRAGLPAGYAMTWKSLTRVLENARVLVLIFGRETEFLIIPKKALGKPERVVELKKLIGRGLASFGKTK